MAGKDHRCPEIVGGLDDFFVANRPTGLNRGRRTGIERIHEPVGKGEHGVAGDNRAFKTQSRLFRLPCRDPAGVDT